ncbi:hypothetical protein QTP86_027036 [Hemibagrus guttatus]|nr:hypothetical protein QTP86_027036 [Hemibagrus guttatus]
MSPRCLEKSSSVQVGGSSLFFSLLVPVSLRPLCLYLSTNCAIDLLPNASPPRGRVYPLSLPESRTMEEYIETALAAGHIRPSTSPAAAGFFFVGKKEGGLRPCIDYWGLNAITIPDPYPLPLVPAALEQLRGQLKDCFTSAPILRHPDPDLPFVVEVDASSSGLGAILSQRHGEPGKLHPCAYYSRKLTAAEANYDVGNRELLAIKAVLEEWRHWMEGARHPFQVLTDHRNLEYLRGAKCLNLRQARWALFFTRFWFMVTYCPGSKYGKADALSRRLETTSNPVLVEPILPATPILAPVQWNLVEEIQRSHADEPPPAGCPPNRIFVPSQFRIQVMQWVHEGPSSGHPGIRRSTQLVRHQFWWPSLALNVEGHVQACPTCAQARTSCQLPEGLLEPLPIPRHPWSHLSVDFLTDLPDSGGYTAVLVVVDRFFKGCKLIPLKGLPSAMQTAEALFVHVFRNFGLPEDIVSDRGSQFTSRVWGLLCVRPGIVDPSLMDKRRDSTKRSVGSLGPIVAGSSTGGCVLGYQPPLFPWSEEPSDVPAVKEWYRWSQEVWERAHTVYGLSFLSLPVGLYAWIYCYYVAELCACPRLCLCSSPIDSLANGSEHFRLRRSPVTHTSFSHLDTRKGNYVKKLLVDYSSAFNTFPPHSPPSCITLDSAHLCVSGSPIS